MLNKLNIILYIMILIKDYSFLVTVIPEVDTTFIISNKTFCTDCILKFV